MKIKAGKKPALWNASMTLFQHLSSFGQLDDHLHEAISLHVPRGQQAGNPSQLEMCRK